MKLIKRNKSTYEIIGWSNIPCPWNNGHDTSCKHVCGVYRPDPHLDTDCINKEIYKTRSRIIAFFITTWYHTLYDNVETCIVAGHN